MFWIDAQVSSGIRPERARYVYRLTLVLLTFENVAAANGVQRLTTQQVDRGFSDDSAGRDDSRQIRVLQAKWPRPPVHQSDCEK